MECPRCRAENAAGTRHCGGCGAWLSAACTACGARQPFGQRFCGECGTALVATADDPRSSSARSSVPRHLAERILTSRHALEGERKHVTVLFADLKSSLELLDGADPEEARTLLDPVLERMMEAVHRYEGTVNQVMGDGIMALFGAPLSHEDHAVRACYAALRMLSAIAELSAETRKAKGLSVQIRVGLNSGEVVVRSIGNDLRMDYSAVGQTTHLAARLEQLATPGSILISGDCLRLAEGYVETKPLGPVAVRGASTAIEVHELVAAVPVRSRLPTAAARGLTPFVGRSAEMEALKESLRQAAQGHGQVVAVVGQAGVGKSRLLHEFIHSPDDSPAKQGWLVLESKSISYGRATPYLPLIDFLKGYFNVQERDDARAIREKVTGKVILLDQSQQESIPPVLDLLGALPEGHAFRQLEPARRQQINALAVTQLMLSESRIQPLIMVFEDLHWNDRQTLGLLKAVIGSIREARVLLFVSYRPKEGEEGPEDQPYDRWDDQPHHRQIRLEPLAPESLEHLLRVLLGEEPQLAPVKRFLAEHTQGNPFFVEEIVRTLVEARILAGARGQYLLAQPFSSVEIPRTVKDVLAARLDRLEPDQKRLLQEAAVIGKDVPFALLQAVSDLPEHELRARLAELQSAEYLYEGRLFPELEYTFKHSLTREVAYRNLLVKRTTSLHAQVAQALIRLAAGRLEEHVEQIAEHAERGELWATAIEYLQRSGEKAFAHYANEEAEKYFSKTLAALGKLPQDRTMLELAVDLRFALRNALIALCKLREIEECLRDAGPVVAQLGDKRRSARHASFMCNHHFLAAELRPVLEVGEAGLRLARESGDRRIEGELLFRIALARHVRGENREAIRLVGEGIDCTVDQRQEERFGLAFTPAVGYRIWLVIMLAECGDFRTGMAHARRAVEISTEAQHPLSEVLGWLAVGHLSLRKGDLDEAIEALERGVGLSDRYSLPLWRLRLETSLGVAHAYCGRLAEGIEMTSRALAGAESIGLMVDQPLLHIHLGEALLLAGRIDEAIAHAKRALELAQAQENRRDEPWARLLIARAIRAAQPGTGGQAVKELEAALSVAVASEARPLEAHCRAMLASIHEAAGDRSKAAELAAAAAALHSALGMRPLPLEPAGALLKAT